MEVGTCEREFTRVWFFMAREATTYLRCVEQKHANCCTPQGSEKSHNTVVNVQKEALSAGRVPQNCGSFNAVVMDRNKQIIGQDVYQRAVQNFTTL
ncbi:hypothetical protein VNO78_08794 [Psophocarpus tetragonolobus]|uniref:Uncharacterized protein n=1 Tax=Psophocarpus tetragonolobus TaxID=3891 RepID=A0AAN9XU25_PSOTE